MKVDIQDAMEISESAQGQEVKFVFHDDTEATLFLLNYDHVLDVFNTAFGRIRRTSVANVIVPARMERILKAAQETGLVGNGELPDENNRINHGHKRTKPTLDTQEGNPDGL